MPAATITAGTISLFIDPPLFREEEYILTRIRHPGGESDGERAQAVSHFSLGRGSLATSHCGRPIAVQRQSFATAGARQHLEPCEFRLCGCAKHCPMVWTSVRNAGSRISGLRWRPDSSQSRERTLIRRPLTTGREKNRPAAIAASALLLGSRGF